MNELKWFDQYSGQSTGELIALEGQYRTDSLVVAFEEALQRKASRIGEEQLVDEERVILAIEALEREINNGGYDQFFRNPSKAYALMVIDALNRIGCTKVATITKDAIQTLGITEPVTVEAIDQVMEEDSDERDTKLAECDNRYYEDAGDLAEPLWSYIKVNQSKIHLLPGCEQVSPPSPNTSKLWWEFWK